MKREECEALILQKLKEISNIAKEYDKSKNFYLSMTITQGRIDISNSYWETDTPLCVVLFDDGGKMHYDN